MSERKIFNYESKILREETFEQYGYYPEKYGRTSNKFVIAICRYCGEKMEVRKGFFNKSGSACHRKCCFEEMKIAGSPFSDPKIQEKAKRIIEEKYGKNRESIGRKISESRRTEKCREKTKKTNLERYGVENVFQAESIKDKIKETNIKKYGTEHAMQNEFIKAKTKKTVQKRYGVDNVMQDKKIHKKAENTNWEKYGCPNPMQNEKVSQKAQKTNRERYGVKSPIQNLEIHEKIKKTNMERYGVEVPSKNPDVINRINKSFRKHVDLDPNEKFVLINTLREDRFWSFLSDPKIRILDAAKEFNLNCASLRNTLISDEFIEKYRECYEKEKRKTQEIIHCFIKDIIEDDSIKISIENRKEISPFELDIFIPDKKFAVEYNGNFWHSEYIIKDLSKAKWQHHNKTKLCQEKGIRLFHIFEHQWNERSKQILNFIRTILKRNKISIAARKCILTHNDAKQFIEDNHIQGKTRSVLKYFNLEYEGEIIASTTASKHHRQTSDDKDIVLSRLCFKENINVPGGSSKMFKYFKEWAKEEGYNRIISWSDNCWTEGNIYKVLGFDLDKEYGPDYFYYNVKNHAVHSKQSQKKGSVGCPDNMTEREWCQERGLYRIYDTGKKLWRFNL